MSSPRFEIVISAENNAYTAWPSLVLAHTCSSRLGQQALVVVHGDEPELLESYKRLIEKGGRVLRAPNYAVRHGVRYAPRNTVASLLHAETEADYLVLCDPDMIVARDWPLANYALEPRQLSFDSVSYLDIDPASSAVLEPVLSRLQIPVESISNPNASGGVPHIIPRNLRETLAREWLECLDAFIPSDETPPTDGTRAIPWPSLASMWSLVIAAARLELEPVLTNFCDTNHLGHRLWPDPNYADCPLIHYCYGDHEFNKRELRGLATGDWPIRSYLTPGSVNATIWNCIDAARIYFGYD